jgi:hypothetical protein
MGFGGSSRIWLVVAVGASNEGGAARGLDDRLQPESDRFRKADFSISKTFESGRQETCNQSF